MRQLPSNLSSKINQSLQTIGNNANPKMEVTVARAKSTVYDSTYWTVETIRETSGLGDVSVAPRRLKAYGRPDRIYEIHVRDGQVYTSIREYPDRLREGFKTQFSLGAGSSVGLAFNGNWERYRKFYRLVTEDKPWVFWVDDKGDLYTRHWDENHGSWEYPDPIIDVEQVDIWDKTYQNNMSVNASGALTTFTGCRTTNKIPVVAGQNYIFDNGDNGNYGRLRWVDDNNGYVYHQDLGPDAGSAIAPLGATGVYFFYAWDVTPMPEPRILWKIITEIPQEPIWKEQMDRKLAEGVKCCKAIRGWKNLVIRHQDHGIIVGYIKTDGKVYYRNYCIQEDGSEAWEYERELTSFIGVAANINLFITNDYRSGFIIEDNVGKIHWFVTHRNWAGMGSPAEAIIGELVDLNFDVTGIKTHLVGLGNEKVAAEDIVGAVMQNYIHEPEQLSSAVGRLKMYVCPPIISPLPDIVSVERLGYTDRQTISITFNYPLECDLDNLKSRFSLKTQSNAIVNIDNVTQNGSTLFIKTTEPMKLMDNLMLTFYDVGAYFLAVRVDETCVIDYGKIIELSILGSPPEVKENVTVFMDVMFKVTEIGALETLLEENLTGAVTNLNFTVIEVDTRYGMVEEKLTSSVANIMFKVTQTSTSPV